MDGTNNTAVGMLGSLQEDNKFNIIVADCAISSKVTAKSQRPS